MWWLLVSGLIIVFVVLSWRAGVPRALGVVGLIAMAAPAWCMLPLLRVPAGSIVGSGVDVKVAVGTAALLLYSFLPGRTFPVRLVPCDLIAIALILVHLTSDTLNSGFSWVTLGRAYAEWYLPYMLGRLAFQRIADLNVLALTFATLAMLLGVLAIVEGVSGVNWLESAFGWRPLEGFPRDASRWGFKRAYGPAMHPIYFGGQLLFFMAGCIYLAWSAAGLRQPIAWLFSPLLPALGIVFTGSRGPVLGLLLALLCQVFFRWPQLRVGLLVCGALLLGLGVAYQEPMLELLESWSGESGQRQVVIEEETHSYSGTRNRLLVFDVYGIALKRSGWLGFGTQAVSGFPVNVPLGPREADTLKKVRFIDNSYMLLTLRFGWLGLLLLLAICAASIGQLWLVSRKSCSTRCRLWAVALCSSSLSLLALIWTVWMPHEIGFPLVWSWGASSGLLLLHRQTTVALPSPEAIGHE